MSTQLPASGSLLTVTIAALSLTSVLVEGPTSRLTDHWAITCDRWRPASAGPQTGVPGAAAARGWEIRLKAHTTKRVTLILQRALSVIGFVGVAEASGGDAQTPSATNTTIASPTGKNWTPPRTPWGDPDLQGVYTNNDESLTPFERPDELAGRRLEDITEAELRRFRQNRSDQRIEADRNRADLRSPLHWFENHFPENSRAWLVVDPPDGKVPPQTADAQRRAAARGEARRGRGPADSWIDRSLYDRCISRGLPGSMMPAIYGNAYQIVQGPGHVAILYEMVHEARVIPLDGRPRLGQTIRQHMGDARGRWEGKTLVVETTNFREEAAYRGANPETLRLIERFTPLASDKVEWSVTVDDPATWTRPWTFAMSLTKKGDSQQPFEYACHEGNYGLEYILRAARAEEKDGEETAKR